MDIFDKRQQLHLTKEVDNYFEFTLDRERDINKAALNLPLHVPIFELTYEMPGGTGPAVARQHSIKVYPTLQFLYSHHIQGAYITPPVKNLVAECYNDEDASKASARFLAAVGVTQPAGSTDEPAGEGGELPPAAEAQGSGAGQQPHSRAELVALAEVVGLDEDLMDSMLEGVNGDMAAVANMLRAAGASAAALAVGKTVVMHGLNSAELNGQRGEIVGRGNTEGRWGVRPAGAEATSRLLSIKAANLQLVAAAAAAVGSPGAWKAAQGQRAVEALKVKVLTNFIRQNPQYTLAALRKGVYGVCKSRDVFLRIVHNSCR
jgi:hypothetical protein